MKCATGFIFLSDENVEASNQTIAIFPSLIAYFAYHIIESIDEWMDMDLDFHHSFTVTKYFTKTYH